ncbi:related to general amidase [Phialocephala subalpina]|uniref:Related to general amidase n=1 Tax=Phialocephala subalpina TaxID=576137 RepID=A0A1L7WSP6_9HELO|nr:related to general amidase [Phialocephala subalpina]
MRESHLPNWQRIASMKRAAIHDSIPKQWLLDNGTLQRCKEQKKLTGSFIEGLLDPETVEITTLDSVDIVEKIRSGNFTSLQVMRAFCWRAAISHQLNGCLLEYFCDDAMIRAEQLDDYYAKHNKTVGPLHGLPLSLKDQFHVQGVDTSMGYVGWLNSYEGRKGTGKEKVVESELIRELRSLGGIPFCKTSPVQTLWFGETNNNIMGYSKNPVNQGLSSGGSSGGEGALQAMKGSPIGAGTDIGGSVSIPASFCGLYSIKPSHGRISYQEAANSSPGQMIINSVVGFMSSSPRSLQLMMASLMSTKPWMHDPEIVKMPWRDSEELRQRDQLCFGIFASDGIVSPHPPIARALQMTVEALEAEGHKVIIWNPPSHSEASKIHSAFTDADGGADVHQQLKLSGEPLIPELRPYFANGPVPPMPLLDFYDLCLKRKDYRRRYLEYWMSTLNQTGTGRPVDGVILPVAPTAAVIPAYASTTNVLDFTAVVIPVTTADSKIDVFNHSYRPLNELDRQNWQAYDPEKYDGAPCGIQVMGRRLEEEKMLSISQIIADALHNYKQQSSQM